MPPDTPLPNPPPEWTLDDAQARFPDLARAALDGGPQHVALPGAGAVVVLSEAEYRRLAHPPGPAPDLSGKTLWDLFANGPFAKLENFDESIVRETGHWRDPEFP